MGHPCQLSKEMKLIFLFAKKGVTILLWSVTLMTTAACTNFAGAMVNRFVLGCLEAAVTLV